MTDPSELYQQKPKKNSPEELDAHILAAAHVQADENANNQSRKGWVWVPAAATTAVLVIGFTFVFDFSVFKLNELQPETLSSAPLERKLFENEPQQEASLTEEDTESFAMEEIVVTGRKREESLADIPLSASVISSDEISDAGIDELNDLFTLIPGLHYDEDGDRLVEIDTSDTTLADTPIEESVVSEESPSQEVVALVGSNDDREQATASVSVSASSPYAGAKVVEEADGTPADEFGTRGRQAAAAISNNSPLAKETSMTIEFINLTDLIPDLVLDIQYATPNNFVGVPIDGYPSPDALLTPDAANALLRVQESLRPQGLTLKVFDAYRPQRAVDHFIRWSQDQTNQTTKSVYYPNIEKSELFALGYLAERSSHSRGSTVDLTIARVNEDGSHQELDMGTIFDFFDPASWPDSSAVNETAQQNRRMLRDLMIEHGFVPFETEWWHFTLKNEPFPDQYFDISVE